jgi:translocation and assembly module TamB
VSADLILRGSIYRPILVGRLDSREGTVYFRNNQFRIIHASADFTDSKRINPIIEITSETIVKSYKIKMNLEGQLDHFNMSLSSDPPLKEMDILALHCRTDGSNENSKGSIGASEATSFV